MNDTLSSSSNVDSLDSLSLITAKDIKIKKQNYSKLSADDKKAKMKSDAEDYLIGLFYIFSSNSSKFLRRDPCCHRTILKIYTIFKIRALVTIPFCQLTTPARRKLGHSAARAIANLVLRSASAESGQSSRVALQRTAL